MNKKGFTLVELLAVIAILAILVIIALPNVLKMFNDAKKNAFLTEVKTLSKEVTNKYIKEFTKGKRIKSVSNKNNSLALNGRELDYYFNLDDDGSLLSIYVSDGNYCVSSSKNYSELTIDDISKKCTYTAIAGTLMKKFYEKSGRTDRSQVESLVFYSDGRAIAGTDEVYDVSEAQDNQIKMYVKENSDSTLLDLIIVGNGKIYLPKDSSELFKLTICGSGCHRNFKSIEFNDSIDTSKVTNMSQMFRGNTFEKLDLSSFDTSKVTDMSSMFSNDWHGVWNKKNIELKGLEHFDTSKVTDMSGMFSGNTFEKLDLSSFDTSKVTDMWSMFSRVTINTLDLSKFDTSKVKKMTSMFVESTIEKIIGFDKFNTSNVTDMSFMFSGNETTILDVSNLDTSNVTDMSYMFAWSAATEIVGLNKFNTSKVTDMGWMFDGSKATTLDLSSFDTSNVTKMYLMFSNCNNLKTIYVSDKFNTLNVTDSYNMFDSTTNLVGGAGTTYDSSKTDKTYARIDGETSNPGYFTLKTN